MKRIANIEKSYLKEDIPPFSSGDTLRVHLKIKEGDKERIQVFQGTVIGRRGSGTGATFTVRKMSGSVGIERVFPLHSPSVAKIENIRSGSVRRAKLYYLRNLTGKSARIKEELKDSVTKKTKSKATSKTPVDKEAIPKEKPVKSSVKATAPKEKVEGKAKEASSEKSEETKDKQE